MKAVIVAISIIMSQSQIWAQALKHKTTAKKDTVSTIKTSKNCDPLLKFGEHTLDCSISKKELQEVKTVFFTCPDWTMVSFEFRKKSNYSSHVNLGNKFSAKTLLELQNTKANDIIYLENVTAKGTGGIIRGLPALSIKVVD